MANFFSLPAWLKEILADSFKKNLILLLCLLGLGLYAAEKYHKNAADHRIDQIAFFFHPQCPHCQKQKEFNPYLKAKYPELHWAEYDTSLTENAKLLVEFIEQSDRRSKRIGVPMTFIGPYVIYGFDTAKTTGMALEQAIQAVLTNNPSLYDQKEQDWQHQKTIDIPLLGKINLAEYSLLSLAMIIGLVDGFNPCAMWVLVYLISLIMTLKDRRKIWLLVGTFIVASGILYFLFMTAWLNVFLFLGYIRVLTLIIGLAALGNGILTIREYLQTKGELSCKIGDPESKKKTISRIEHIVHAPISCTSVLAIIALAFIINSIEFACSAALPAIYTHTLALRNLPPLLYYGYILVYDFFFMLDDLIIFSMAVLALDAGIGHRYAKYCKIIGGIVLLLLGGVMVFQPGMLR
ncbi:MAG: hypothetical protein KKD63_05175 [Proteobacteria bacterium]|nr:hypothetical protein [Desulfobulbaceae bacterium]MBU4152253.1 hypothetical protein [Pseudomonadota bacterium]